MGMPVAPAFWPRVLGLGPKPITPTVATPPVTAAVDATPLSAAAASKTQRRQSPATAVIGAEAATAQHQRRKQEPFVTSSSRCPAGECGQQSSAVAMADRQASGLPLSSPPPPPPPPPPLPLPSRRKIYPGHSNFSNSLSARNNEDSNKNTSEFRSTLVSGLYGSALVPTGGRTSPPAGWNKKRSQPGSIVIGRAHTPPIAVPDTIARMQGLSLNHGKKKNHKDATMATASIVKPSPFNMNGRGGTGTEATAGTMTAGGKKRCIVGGGRWPLADEATAVIPRHAPVQTLGRSASIGSTSNARGRGLRRKIY